MKICIVTPTFFPEPGGPSIFVDNFVKSLRKGGHRIAIIAISEGNDSFHQEENYSVIKISRRRNRFFRVLKTILAIIQYGRRSEVVFSCGLFLESAVSKWVVRKPLIIRIGGDPVWEKWTNQVGLKADLNGFYDRRHGLKVEFRKYLQKFSCLFADKIITPCHFFKNIVEKWGIKKDKIEVVYNGSNMEDMYLPPKEEIKRKLLLNDQKVILTVGRFIEFKRIDEIIESFSEIKHEDLCLLIIGGGFKKEQLVTLSKELNLTEKVKFLGVKPHYELLHYLKAADLFVLNSVDEVMPNIVLESLAVGTPVIAPKGGGIPEIIQDQVDGWLYPLKKSNKGELREAIEKLLWDEGFKKQLIQNGYFKIGQFNWKHSYEKIISIMKQI